jgi:hypothetical protein
MLSCTKAQGAATAVMLFLLVNFKACRLETKAVTSGWLPSFHKTLTQLIHASERSLPTPQGATTQ